MEKETTQEHIKNGMTSLEFTVTIVVIMVIMLRIVESTSDNVKEKANYEDNRRILQWIWLTQTERLYIKWELHNHD